jgi:hypothetical protein
MQLQPLMPRSLIAIWLSVAATALSADVSMQTMRELSEQVTLLEQLYGIATPASAAAAAAAAQGGAASGAAGCDSKHCREQAAPTASSSDSRGRQQQEQQYHHHNGDCLGGADEVEHSSSSSSRVASPASGHDELRQASSAALADTASCGVDWEVVESISTQLHRLHGLS